MQHTDGGFIHLLIGAMYAGKTDESIRLKKRAIIAGKKCLSIKSGKDTRYGTQPMITTHDGIATDAIISADDSLQHTVDSVPDLDTYDCIFVDEVQFFKDGAVTCDSLANQGFEVIATGLQGDYQRRFFHVLPN